ncbi:hypothetical protein BN1708_019285, partial [Verticillium longisporum]
MFRTRGTLSRALMLSGTTRTATSVRISSGVFSSSMPMTRPTWSLFFDQRTHSFRLWIVVSRGSLVVPFLQLARFLSVLTHLRRPMPRPCRLRISWSTKVTGSRPLSFCYISATPRHGPRRCRSIFLDTPA